MHQHSTGYKFYQSRRLWYGFQGVGKTCHLSASNSNMAEQIKMTFRDGRGWCTERPPKRFFLKKLNFLPTLYTTGVSCYGLKYALAIPGAPWEPLGAQEQNI